MNLILSIDGVQFELGHIDLIKLVQLLDDYESNMPVFEALAGHPDSLIRMAVSSKRHLNSDTVRLLAKDKHILQIQENLALYHLESPGLGYEDVLYFLSKDIPEWTMEIALRLDRLHLMPDEIRSMVEALSQDSSPYVRAALATKMSVPDDVLQKLAKDSYNMVSRLAIEAIGKRGNKIESNNMDQQMKGFTFIADLMLNNYHDIQDASVLHDEIEEPEELEELRPVSEILGYGVHAIDEETGGIGDKELVLFIGSSRDALTAFALGVAMHARSALDEPIDRIAIVSFHAVEKELSMHMLSMRSHVPSALMKSGQLDHEQWKAIASASGEIAESGIYIMSARALPLHAVLAEVKRLRNPVEPLKLVVIDGLEYLLDGEEKEETSDIINENAQLIRSFADDLCVPVIVTVAVPENDLGDFAEGLYKGYYQVSDSVLLARTEDSSVTIDLVKHCSGQSVKAIVEFDEQWAALFHFVEGRDLN